MLSLADFDTAYSTKPCNYEKPICQAPECFIASYPPIAKVGDASGRFFVNTYLLQPNRFLETVGPVTVRSEDFKCSK
jgi:hypothetical protein